MKNTVRFALLSAALGLLSTSAAFAKVDCAKLVLLVKHDVAANPSATLQIVEKQVGIAPACACELVKAAIQASKADVKLVAAIVETAATVAPEHRHLIGQCAVAVAPDALSAVQAVLKKLEPKMKGKPELSSKNALPETAKAKPTSNPLDFPGSSIEAYLSANSGNGNNGNNSQGGGDNGGGTGTGSGGTGNTANNSGGGIFSGGGGNNSGGGGTGGGNSGGGGFGGGGGGSTGGGGGGFIGGVPGGPGGGGITPTPGGAPPGGGGPGGITPPAVTDPTA